MGGRGVGDSYSNGTVMRVPIAGGSPVTVASSQPWVSNLAVDEENVYWGTAGSPSSILRAPLGGGDPMVVAPAPNVPRGIVVDSTTVYWVEEGDITADGGNGDVSELTSK